MSSEKWLDKELAKLLAKWRAGMADIGVSQDELDAALASLSAPKPEGEWVLVPREPTDAMVVAFAESWFSTSRAIDDPEMEDAYAAMLAAAPKPSSMNDNAVAVNEVAPVNDKPESAEAVGEVLRSEDGVALVAMFDDSLRPGAKVYTAPPRPEASAPDATAVGVGYAKRLATWLWQQHYREDAPQWEPCDDLMGLLSQIDNMVSGLTRSEALAQQPAACDGTCHRSPSGLCETHEAEAHAYLAVQQKGGPQE